MLFFRRSHDILQVPQIPRERAAFVALVEGARRSRRISRLKRFIAGNFFVWALIILFVWMPLHNAPARVGAPARHVHVYQMRGVHPE